MTEAMEYRLLIENQCAKLSAHSQGKLSYQCACDATGKNFIRINGNTHQGAFSREWLSLDQIIEYINPYNNPFRSTILNPLFTKRSANNAPFLAAILRQLGLLLPVEGFPSYSKRGSDMALRHQLKTLQESNDKSQDAQLNSSQKVRLATNDKKS